MRRHHGPLSRFRPGAAAALAVMLAVTGCARSRSSSAGDGGGNAAAGSRPNIVVIMTDDQNLESLRVMPKVRRLIAKMGTTFRQNVVSFPMCCPSRATYLTGQYATNHGVRSNGPPWGGYGAFEDQETTFPAALRADGYATIHIGKYLNGYGAEPPVVVPPGWSQFFGGVDPSTYRYFRFTLLENGVAKTYGTRDAEYQTDVLTDVAVSTIRRSAHERRPFFINVAYLAPHVQVPEGGLGEQEGRAVPAPRHASRFAEEPLRTSPSFDEADARRKPNWVRYRPRLSDSVKAEMTAAYRAYLGSLLAVDDGVGRIVDALRRTGVLENTVVIFTTDNGYFFGEHRIPAGKLHLYEPAIRVPLLIRGPGVPRGSRRSLVANVDLAPTILDLAHAKPLRRMDGRSLVPLLEGRPARSDRAVLLQSGTPDSSHSGIRTPRYTYVESAGGERELYDLVRDPDQLRNLADDTAFSRLQAGLARRLAALETCAGDSCR